MMPVAVRQVPLSFAQDHLMPAFRLDRRGEAEIVVPANKFKPPACLYQTEKLLREEHLRRNSSFDGHVLAAIADGKCQTLVVGLRHRIKNLRTIAGVHAHAVLSPGPASLVFVENSKPDKAVQQIQSARSQETGKTVEMVEELAVRPHIERAQQHIGKVEPTEVAIEVAHVAEDERRFDPGAPRLGAGVFDHGGAEIEPAIRVASP